MDRDTMIFENKSFRFEGGKRGYVVRKTKAAGDSAGSIMVSGNDENRNTGSFEPGHAIDKKESGVIVLPVTIIEVTRQEKKVHLLINGQVYQVIKGPSAGPPNFVNRGIFICLKPNQGAVQVNISSVKKTKHFFPLECLYF
jgi:hypothetical protein